MNKYTSIYKKKKHSSECSGSPSGWSIVQADAADVKSNSIPGKTKVTSSKKNSNVLALQLAYNLFERERYNICRRMSVIRVLAYYALDEDDTHGPLDCMIDPTARTHVT
jgi:hypothetical protein